MLHTQLQGRLAAPWTSLVVVVLAVPFGAALGRRNVYVGVANSVFIAFAYFIVLKLGLALGTGGYVPPWLAAWSPNILFAGAGLLLGWRVR
jgi:lipopolysaccharide export LptBFGC system permease protein LptF